MSSAIRKAIVFCSYAREDGPFVQRLRAELAEHGIELTGDWNLETLRPYLEQLYGAIDSADVFLFVISPMSVASSPCRDEIEHALRSNKRIAPIVRENVEDALVHSELRQIQYVFFRDQDVFEDALQTLVRSITLDLAWVKMHTFVLERALDWERKLNNPASLLRGVDLETAEEWMATAGTDATKEPRPTQLQTNYISASRQERFREERERADLMAAKLTAETTARFEAEKRAEEQELASKRLLRRATMLAVALCIAIATALFALYQLNVAEARRAAAIALSIMATGYDRALELSAQAYARHQDAETLGSLMTAMQRNGGLKKFLRTHSGTTWAVGFDPAGSVFASTHGDGSLVLWDARTYQPLGSPLKAHAQAVKGIAFSPDGTLMASGSEDKTIVLWDVKTRKPLAVLTGHEKEVEDVAFSPDARTLASASLDGKVRLWDVASRKPRGEPLVGHSGPVWCVEFSPDGTLLASGSEDDTIILWNPESHEQIDSLAEHTDTVRDLSFSPDGSMLASGSDDDSIALWDVPSRKSLGSYLAGHTNDVTSVAFSRDGRFLASSGDTTVRLWNVSTHELETTFSGHAVAINTVAFSADGKQLVSGGWDNNILVWDADKPHRLRDTLAETPSVIETLDVAHDGTLLAGDRSGRVILKQAASAQVRSLLPGAFRTTRLGLALSPDGRFLATGNTDNAITLWDLSTNPASETLLQGHTRDVNAVAFSPDNQTLISGSDDGTVMVWDVTDRKSKAPPLRRHTGAIYGVAFSPDGSRFASGSTDQSVVVWNAKTLLPEGARFIDHADGVSRVVFTPDGHGLVSGSGDNRVSLWDLRSHHVQTLNPREDFTVSTVAFAFRPDSRMLAFVNKNNRVILIDSTHAGSRRASLPFPGLEISCLAFSRDGRTLAIAGSEKDILLWDVAAGKRIGSLKGHSGRINGLAFSPDGTVLVSAGADGTARLWDWRKQQTLKVLGEPSFVRSVAFAPNGPLVALGFDDGRVVLADRTAEGKPGRALLGHKETVFKVAFSPNGKLLASASKDRTVMVWDATTGKPVGPPLAVHTESVTAIAFSPDGKILASGSEDDSIVLWDTASFRAIGSPLRGHLNNVTSLAFSPDGRLLASGSRDRTIILWEMSKSPPVAARQPFRGHNGSVFSLAFSKDGKTLASGGYRAVFLWNLAVGEPLGAFLTAPDEVHALMFSADGKTLYSGGEKVFSWSIDPEAWLELARSIANRDQKMDKPTSFTWRP